MSRLLLDERSAMTSPPLPARRYRLVRVGPRTLARGDTAVDALPDRLVGERQLDVARADERQAAWRHLVDRDDAHVLDDRRDRGLRDDRRVRARRDEVTDEADPLDL